MFSLTDWLNKQFQTLVTLIKEISLWEIVLLVIFSVLLSLYFFIKFLRHKKWLLVDLGKHKWLVK
jgi:hypothetical protein